MEQWICAIFIASSVLAHGQVQIGLVMELSANSLTHVTKDGVGSPADNFNYIYSGGFIGQYPLWSVSPGLFVRFPIGAKKNHILEVGILYLTNRYEIEVYDDINWHPDLTLHHFLSIRTRSLSLPVTIDRQLWSIGKVSFHGLLGLRTRVQMWSSDNFEDIVLEDIITDTESWYTKIAAGPILGLSCDLNLAGMNKLIMLIFGDYELNDFTKSKRYNGGLGFYGDLSRAHNFRYGCQIKYVF